MLQCKYPEPTVGALLFFNDKLFLMKSHKWGGRWVLPGGHIELGESMENALIREVKEETNLDIVEDSIKFVCFHEFIFEDSFYKKKHFIFFDFFANVKNNEVILNHEAQEYGWFILDDALKLNLEKYTKKAIEEYINLNFSH